MRTLTRRDLTARATALAAATALLAGCGGDTEQEGRVLDTDADEARETETVPQDPDEDPDDADDGL